MKNFDNKYNELIKEMDNSEHIPAKPYGKSLYDHNPKLEKYRKTLPVSKPMVSPTSKYFASFDIYDQTITLQRLDDGLEVDRHNYDNIEDFKRGILDTVVRSGYQYIFRDKGVYQKGFDLISYIIPRTK